MLFWFSGIFSVVWNIITVSLRQQIIPDHLLGRVNSVYRFLGWGSMPLGALAGGWLANAFGLRAPWLIGGAVVAVALVARPAAHHHRGHRGGQGRRQGHLTRRRCRQSTRLASDQSATPRTPAPPSIT